MTLSPNLAACVAAVLFGLVVFPWRATIVSLGQPGVFLFTGGAYVLMGIVLMATVGFAQPMTLRSGALAALTAVMYLCALLCCNYAFGHSEVNLPIAAAITAAYPLISAAITVVLLGQRFSLRETVFFMMAVVGVVGLGLSSK
jgi:drug/metabolite transporter (DMT)-like permease